jgi:hypothetical protein
MTTTTDEGITTISTGWTEDKQYSITYSTVNRLINGLFGAVAPFEDVIHADENVASHYLGTISKAMYDDIAQSIIDPGQLVFWTEQNVIKLRKVSVDFGPNTYLDDKRNAIVGVDNLITLVPKIVDQDGKVWPDITEIQIKNMNKLEFPISINNGNSSEYKTSVTNGASVTFKLENRGRATLRFKAIVPELSHIWISLYPELYGYDEDGLAKLATWAANQQ